MKPAIDALQRGDFESALMHLVTLWRETRAVELADAIDQLSARAIHGALESKLRTTFKRSVADDQEWLRRLEPFGIDPRIATAMITWLNDPPLALKRTRSMPFWSGVIDALLLIKDPRTRVVRAEWILPGSRLREHLQTLHSHAASWKATQVDVSGLAPFLVVTPSRADEALGAVYRSPHDLTLRHVCADALSEAGDPRGEFISLQLAESLTDEQRARQRQLLKKHSRSWLGPLASIERKGSARFEKGFPVEIEIVLNANEPAAFQKFVGLDEWSTVELLHLGAWQGEHREMLEHPVMRSLHSVTGVSAAMLESTRVLPIEKMEARWRPVEPLLPRFFGGETMPALRRLTLPSFYLPDGFDPLWNTPVMNRLESLIIPWPQIGSLAAWLEALPLMPRTLTTLTLGDHNASEFEARLTRIGGGPWRCVLRASRSDRMKPSDEPLEAMRERMMQRFTGVSFE